MQSRLLSGICLHLSIPFAWELKIYLQNMSYIPNIPPRCLFRMQLLQLNSYFFLHFREHFTYVKIKINLQNKFHNTDPNNIEINKNFYILCEPFFQLFRALSLIFDQLRTFKMPQFSCTLFLFGHMTLL